MVKDALGREIKPGCHVVYAVADGGHRVAMRHGVVTKVSDRSVAVQRQPADEWGKRSVSVRHFDRIAVVGPLTLQEAAE